MYQDRQHKQKDVETSATAQTYALQSELQWGHVLSALYRRQCALCKHVVGRTDASRPAAA